jgi:hypothetical protein
MFPTFSGRPSIIAGNVFTANHWEATTFADIEMAGKFACDLMWHLSAAAEVSIIANIEEARSGILVDPRHEEVNYYFTVRVRLDDSQDVKDWYWAGTPIGVSNPEYEPETVE